MKRSYVIERLSSLLYDTSNDRTEAQCKNTATFVLDVLESIGMQPPYVKFETPEPNGNEFKWGEHKWEPECEIPEYTFKCPNCKCEE